MLVAVSSLNKLYFMFRKNPSTRRRNHLIFGFGSEDHVLTLWKHAVVCRCMREQLRNWWHFQHQSWMREVGIWHELFVRTMKKFSELVFGPLAYATLSHTGCGFPTMSKLWSHQFSCTKSRWFCNFQNHITTKIDTYSI